MAKEIKVKRIAPSTGYFRIDNGKSVYYLMDKMTPSMTQDELADFYETEKKKGNPVPMNSIQHIELFDDAMKSGNSDLLNFLNTGVRGWLNTLTRVVYNPAGKKDETIHNYGTSDAYSIIGDIVGEDNWVNKIKEKKVLESLVKTRNVKRLNKISNAITQTPMYLWRFNSKPSERTERVVRFGAGDDWFDLSAGGGPSGEVPAFLVGKVK